MLLSQSCSKSNWMFCVAAHISSHMLLICFVFSAVKERYAGHKWPTSALNEYSVLIAVRRHPGSNHEICARTRDHCDNSPCPDCRFSVHSLSPPLPPRFGVALVQDRWLVEALVSDGGAGGVEQSLMGDIKIEKNCHPSSLIAVHIRWNLTNSNTIVCIYILSISTLSWPHRFIVKTLNSSCSRQVLAVS